MINAKITSSLIKAFADDSIENFETLLHISALKGENIAFQLLYDYEKGEDEYNRTEARVSLHGELSKYATLKRVKQMPVEMPVNPCEFDEGYLRTTPGIFPDMLEPIGEENYIYPRVNELLSLWIELELPKDMKATESPLTVIIENTEGKKEAECTLRIEVIDAALPDGELKYTQWFHVDCLADYYHVPVFSERHWEIIENFAKTAVSGGINMLLTPVFTPPLDTYIGGERPTTQLVGVIKRRTDYSFDYTLLDRFVDMCDRVGIKYLEISHLFTQWGALHAPKIMATVDGEYKKIFGWETDAHGDEYKEFLEAFLPDLLSHMAERGDSDRLYFHISDEPEDHQIEDYKKSKGIVEKLLDGYTIMDALSSYDFYKAGIVKTPVAANNHIAPFIEGKADHLWTYYCCAQCVDVSNRLVAMPSARNRFIGIQLYKYNIEGFLHWGYNFYNGRFSRERINPFIDLSGDGWVPAGDTHSVYPGDDGHPIESIRFAVFRHALEDLRAMRLAESFYSHDEIVKRIEETLGYTVTFDKCALTPEEIHSTREMINSMIKAKI